MEQHTIGISVDPGGPNRRRTAAREMRPAASARTRRRVIYALGRELKR
jgi:hypothetical protein